MRWIASFVAATLIPALVTGCASRSLSMADRKEACRIVVEEQFDRPLVQPNPLSGPGGGLAGAGLGALAGLQAGVLSIFTVPIGAAVGAVGGIVCAAAGQEHPTADADFERLLSEVDPRALQRALESELNGPRAECGYVTTKDATSAPDAVIAIDSVHAEMTCLLGRQQYWVAARWRATRTPTGKVFASGTTTCTVESYRSVDAWFADPAYARVEIERVVTKTGERIGQELFSRDTLPKCQFRALESGEFRAR